jgi:hypothetical protein
MKIEEGENTRGNEPRWVTKTVNLCSLGDKKKAGLLSQPLRTAQIT